MITVKIRAQNKKKKRNLKTQKSLQVDFTSL
jgi:hypothetical protein